MAEVFGQLRQLLPTATAGLLQFNQGLDKKNGFATDYREVRTLGGLVVSPLTTDDAPGVFEEEHEVHRITW